MVLAERVERDVLDDDHLRVGDVEDRTVDQPLRVDVIAGGQLGVHPMDPFRRSLESLALGVLSDLGQDLVDGRLDPAIPGVDADAFDQRLRAVRLLADLGLDLVDDRANVARELGPIRHLADGTSDRGINDPSRARRSRLPAEVRVGDPRRRAARHARWRRARDGDSRLPGG